MPLWAKPPANKLSSAATSVSTEDHSQEPRTESTNLGTVCWDEGDVRWKLLIILIRMQKSKVLQRPLATGLVGWHGTGKTWKKPSCIQIPTVDQLVCNPCIDKVILLYSACSKKFGKEEKPSAIRLLVRFLQFVWLLFSAADDPCWSRKRGTNAFGGPKR